MTLDSLSQDSSSAGTLLNILISDVLMLKQSILCQVLELPFLCQVLELRLSFTVVTSHAHEYHTYE